jgi:hypothetical protein
VDASVRGLAFVSRAPRPPGEFLRVACPLQNGQWVDADCIVARSQRRTDGQNMVGVFFTRLQPQFANELADATGRPRPAAAHRSGTIPKQHAMADNDDFDLFAQIPRTRAELHDLYRQAVAEVSAKERHTGRRR